MNKDKTITQRIINKQLATGKLKDKFLEYTNEWMEYEESEPVGGNTKEKKLILVRGASGAGKSTFAYLFNNNIENYITNQITADDYFMSSITYENWNNCNMKRDYKFDYTQIRNAHTFCKMVTEYFMLAYREYVVMQIQNKEFLDGHILVVHNTFTEEWEMKPYYELANQYGYKVTTIIMENRHNSDSIHNVPNDVVLAQKERFQIKL
jgi:predicted kinase|tara:strand:- start:1100 stop:1723 length:624 start_codon:yes stop_codon:yes gene_type:complete